MQVEILKNPANYRTFIGGNMNESVYYSSYKHFMVRLDTSLGEIEISDEKSGGRAVMQILGLFVDGKCEVDFKRLTGCRVTRSSITGAHTLTARVTSDEFSVPTNTITLVDQINIVLNNNDYGVRHVVDNWEHPVSRLEFAKNIAATYNDIIKNNNLNQP